MRNLNPAPLRELANVAFIFFPRTFFLSKTIFNGVFL